MVGLWLGISGPTAPETRTPFAIRFGGQGALTEWLGSTESVINKD
jgi:hypothetical protein